ncbi:M56 family metallopeptidase [Salinibacter ruber]|nr:M56 family metallopeptidase [Salinibacter ruber]MCS3615169.1 TonB family protein [Salinibacter ruber]MCS3784117.1 TonB family protein [Salinibacter ruber]MCS4137795.1 TonB family protein [Salinibacter ruber]MCS4197451.1 TonB family protein [Salinibacter ruber]
MQMILDGLSALGTATIDLLWRPVLAWTALALPLWALLRWTDRLHPNAEYRLSQLLLAALPVGIAAVGVIEMLPDASESALRPARSVVALPAIETGPVSVLAGSWTWMHAVGLLTVGALGIGLFRLGRLGLDVLVSSRVRRRLDTAVTPSLEAEVDRLQERLGVRRSVQLCISTDATVPMTLGGRRPTVLVPERLAAAPDKLRMTLHHELVHVRRWDDCAQLLERFVAALFAAHPLVGRLRRQIGEARERACDAAVLDDGETPAGEYARLLTAFADRASSPRLSALSLSESPSSLIDRLSAMRSSMPSFLTSRAALGTALVAVGLTLTLGVVACSDSVGPSSSPEEATESSPSTAADDDEVYMVVDDPPELVGGMKALQQSVEYPEVAREAGLEGRVIVQFVVDEEETVTNLRVTQGVDKVLDEAAIEAVEEQTFTPGRQDGEPRKVQMSLPVTFRLDDGSDGEANESGDDATTSSAASEANSGGRLFEKAGIQRVRVLMNEEGRLLIDDEPVEMSSLTDAVRQRITADAARAALIYADGAPGDRIDAAEASLRALDLQMVYIKPAA